MRLMPMQSGGTGGLGVQLEPVSAETRDDFLMLFKQIEKLDQDRSVRTALDAAARFVRLFRYDGRGDPIAALDELEKALRGLR